MVDFPTVSELNKLYKLATASKEKLFVQQELPAIAESLRSCVNAGRSSFSKSYDSLAFPQHYVESLATTLKTHGLKAKVTREATLDYDVVWILQVSGWATE